MRQADDKGKQAPTAEQIRRADLAKIHLAKKELGLDDGLYRDVLRNLFGVASAADLDKPNRNLLLAWFRGQGWGKSGGKRRYPGTPVNIDDPVKGPMLKKIGACLTEAKRPWAYVDSMSRKMFGVDKVGWCSLQDLHKLIAALLKDAVRHGRRTGPADPPAPGKDASASSPQGGPDDQAG